MKLRSFVLTLAAAGIGIGATGGIISLSNRAALKSNGTKISDFENVLDIFGVSVNDERSDFTRRITQFSDAGSNHAFSLPPYQYRKYWGSFTNATTSEGNEDLLSKSINVLELYELHQDGTTSRVNFRSLSLDKVHLKQYPGGLWQEFELPDLTLQVDLRFIHEKVSTVKYNIINHSGQKRSFKFVWKTKLESGIWAAFDYHNNPSTIDNDRWIKNDNGQPQLFAKNSDQKLPGLYIYEGTTQLVNQDLVDQLNHVYKTKDPINGRTIIRVYPETPGLDKILNKVNAEFRHYDAPTFNWASSTYSLSRQGNEWQGYLGHRGSEKYMFHYPNHTKFFQENIGKLEAWTDKPFVVEANQENDLFVTNSFSFTAQQRLGYFSQVKSTGERIYHEGLYQDYLNDILNNKEKLEHEFEQAHKRWDYYLDNLIGHDDVNNFQNQKIAVKGAVTLTTNWKAGRGYNDYGGVFPSIYFSPFHYYWAWDSWKQAVGEANFDPKLAMDNIRLIYDRQIIDNDIEGEALGMDKMHRKNHLGMIPNNLNDGIGARFYISNPPLSGWAIWRVYEKIMQNFPNKVDFRTGQKLQDEVIEFMKDMYMRLMSYHAWWYFERDGDGNGAPEYGSNRLSSRTGIVKQMADESGMDDAARFAPQGAGGQDNGMEFTIIRDQNNHATATTVMQESIDLQSFFYAEKMYLIKIGDALKKAGVPYNQLSGIKAGRVRDDLVEPTKRRLASELRNGAKERQVMHNIGQSYERDKAQLQKDANWLQEYVNRKMFDPDTGFFYDLKYGINDTTGKREYNDDLLLIARGKGVEGVTPMWANMASKANAAKTRDTIMNPHMFNTYMPFPSIAWDNPSLNPTGYWRGPVWVDYSYFGIKGLDNYHYSDDASYMVNKTFAHAEGLTGIDPIRENYNPVDGKGLSSRNFSWSAASFIDMYEDFSRRD